MPSSQSTHGAENAVRMRILEAAEKRFQDFGYGKTTMAEIAEDVDMSAANLYRYFQNKLDIGEACASRCMQGHLERLRLVARQGDSGAARRLEDFFLENLRANHEIVSQRPRINEMVELITTRKPELFKAMVRDIESLLAEILVYGNATGEFDVVDVMTGASCIHAAMVLYEVPIFVGLYPYEEYARQAQSLARLLVRGLRRQ